MTNTATITPDSFTIETEHGSRIVHGEGTAIMVRNFEQARCANVVVVPTRVHIDLTGAEPTDTVVFLNDDPAPEPMFPFHLDASLQQSLYGDPLSLDHDFELAEIEHTDPAVIEQIAAGQALHDAAVNEITGEQYAAIIEASVAEDVLFGVSEIDLLADDFLIETAVAHGVSAEARRDELELLGAKAIRPIASGLGVKGARIMQKAEMIDKIIKIEFGL